MRPDVRSFARACIATLLVGLLPAASAIGVQAASATRVIVVESAVLVDISANLGTGLSIIQTCPRGGTPDNSVTGVAFANFDEFGYRLRSSETWPHGRVDRFTSTVPAGRGHSTLPAELVCRLRVPASASQYVGRIGIRVRIWGPARSGRLLDVSLISMVSKPTFFVEPLDGEPVLDSFVSASRLRQLRIRHVEVLRHPGRAAQADRLVARTTRMQPRGTFAELAMVVDVGTRFRPTFPHGFPGAGAVPG